MARDELVEATTVFREMCMTFWTGRAQTEAHQLE
jgi:hypothetical protein